jgi:hypothetical protein
MKTDRELIQQALKMIRSLRYRSLTDVSDEIISALEERLAQPEQEHWDAIPDTFNRWWDADYDDTGNPFRKDSPAYWAWSGWKAASKQPEQEPVAWLDGPHLVVRLDMRDRLAYKGPWVDLGRAIPDKWTPFLFTAPPQRKEQA